MGTLWPGTRRANDRGGHGRRTNCVSEMRLSRTLPIRSRAFGTPEVPMPHVRPPVHTGPRAHYLPSAAHMPHVRRRDASFQKGHRLYGFPVCPLPRVPYLSESLRTSRGGQRKREPKGVAGGEKPHAIPSLTTPGWTGTSFLADSAQGGAACRSSKTSSRVAISLPRWP